MFFTLFYKFQNFFSIYITIPCWHANGESPLQTCDFENPPRLRETCNRGFAVFDEGSRMSGSIKYNSYAQRLL